MQRRFAAVLGALALSALALPAAATAERPLTIGLTDPVFANPSQPTRQQWLARAKSANSDLVLLAASWAGIAPGARPPGFNPSNPGDPNYDWAALDAAVRDAAQQGLRVALLVTQSPSWAEGPGRPASAPAGTWKPRPPALEDFGRAIARRYSGNYSAPGGQLPKVRYFQLWAEPNLSVYLTPQWKQRRPVAPRHYRKMLRGFYEGVKKGQRAAKVVSGGTAPYGDPGVGGDRMQPVRFWRELLCLKGQKLKTAKCRKPAKLDIVAHHPINVGRPRRHALNRDDASTPDIGRITRVVRKAVKTGRLLPHKRKPVWATELWWDSKPPDPRGVPEQQHARWLAESFYLLWKQRVSTVVWFHIRDPESTDLSTTQESGLYLKSGEAKRALRAFRFPFVTEATGGGIRVWGRAPKAGRVKIQVKRGNGWRTVAGEHVKRHGVFTRTVRVHGKPALRAVIGSQQSLPFKTH